MKFDIAPLAKMIDARRKPYDDWKKENRWLSFQHGYTQFRHEKTEPCLADLSPRMAAHPSLEGETTEALQEGLELLLRKVPFPYTAMTDHSYWLLPAVLPKEAYDSELTGECSDDDYELVKIVCRYFDIQNQEQYNDLYL